MSPVRSQPSGTAGPSPDPAGSGITLASVRTHSSPTVPVGTGSPVTASTTRISTPGRGRPTEASFPRARSWGSNAVIEPSVSVWPKVLVSATLGSASMARRMRSGEAGAAP